MVSTIYRVLRLTSYIAGIVYGVMELRTMYLRRKHLWRVLRRLVRQLG